MKTWNGRAQAAPERYCVRALAKIEDERRADALQFRHVQMQALDVEAVTGVDEPHLLTAEAKHPERNRNVQDAILARVPDQQVQVGGLHGRARQIGEGPHGADVL